jgi:AcrR family transcriptional regulator
MATSRTRAKKGNARAPAAGARKQRRAVEVPYHHGDLRRAILDAARAELDAAGAAALSMREVARRAGVSHAAPYHHFPDKDDLLAHLGAEGFTTFAAYLRQAADEGGAAPRGRLMRMGFGYLRFAKAHPGLFHLMWSAMPTGKDDVWMGPSTESFQVLVDEVARVRAEVGQPGSPLGDAVLYWSMVHGLATLSCNLPSVHPLTSPEPLYEYISARLDALYEPGAPLPPPLPDPSPPGAA